MSTVLDKTAQKVARHAPEAVKSARALKPSDSLLGSTLGATSNFLNTAQMGLFILPMLSGVLGWMGKAPKIGGVFTKASNLVGAPTAFATANTVESALDKAHNKLSGLLGAETLSKAGDVTSRAMGALENVAGKADNYIGGVSKGFTFAKNKIGGIKNLTVHDAIYKGSIHAGSALLAYQNVKTTNAGLSTLKDMCQDLSTNGKRPSTFQVLFGNVPNCVKEVRMQFLKTTVVRSIADAIGIGISTKFAGNQNMGGKTMMLTMGLQMGVGAISSFISSGNNAPDMYKAMKDLQATGQALPPELVAQFIGSASVEAKKSGGAESKPVQILAQKYVAEGLTAEQILAKVNSGAINQDRAQLRSTQIQNSRGQLQQPSAGASNNLRAMQSPMNFASPVMGTHTANHANSRMPQPFAAR